MMPKRPSFSRTQKWTPILILVLITASCWYPSADAAEKTAEKFMRGLTEENPALIEETAPFFAELPEDQKNKISQNIPDKVEWEVLAVSRRGGRARVKIELTDGENRAKMILPLKAEAGQWYVQRELSFSTTIDVVPAEKSDSSHTGATSTEK